MKLIKRIARKYPNLVNYAVICAAVI